MSESNRPFSTDSNESIGFLFIRVYNLWHRKIKKALRPYQLTHPQFVVLTTLAYLQQTEKEVTQVMIAQTADIDVMTVSTILKNLQKNKRISRSESQTDTRSKVVDLTAEGTQIVQTTVPIVEAIDAAFFAALGMEQTKLRSLLFQLLREVEHD